ncbi:MAG: GPR endopeptidase [Candidatus Carbobacillus sp.]|nr:GPR endopeptidase [Candidatus Carbobacillus sp.]
MTQNLDLRAYALRTDLAVEAVESMEQVDQQAAKVKEDGSPSIDGIEKRTEILEDGAIRVIYLDILTEEAEKKLGKVRGAYMTLEMPGLRSGDSVFREKATDIFFKALTKFLKQLHLNRVENILVIGLGNKNVTADALGPVAVDHLLVTRHLFLYAPESVASGYRSVSALAPGVLGTTGIETGEIVEAVVTSSQPDLVVVIDALAARSLERLYTTIQVSDTGIQPGSGIGNKRRPLNRETLGVPVIAIGVPTVVDATTVATDTIELLLKHFGYQLRQGTATKTNKRQALVPDFMPLYDRPPIFRDEDELSPELKERLFGQFGVLTDEEKYALIREVLQPLGYNLIVTPKDVDAFIEDVGQLLAVALNRVFHEKVHKDNAAMVTH